MSDDNKSDYSSDPLEAPVERTTQNLEQGTPEKRKPGLPLPLKLFLVLCVVFVASIGVWNSYFRSHQTPHQTDDTVGMENRSPAPELQFSTKNGEVLKLSQYKNKVILLSFWAHWCTPCLMELPSIKALYERVDNPDFVILALNEDEQDSETLSTVNTFWTTKEMPFETYFDKDKSAAEAFKIETLPANFIIDKEGRVVVSSFGSNDWSNPVTIDMIQALLTE